MNDNNLTKTEFMSIRCLEMVAAGLQAREREINAAIEQLQREQAAFQKDKKETFAAIEDAHQLEMGSIGTTYRIDPIAQGQAARLVPIPGATNQTSEQKTDAENTDAMQASGVN